MIKGLEALERLMTDYYEMCQDLGDNDDQYQRCNLTSERATIENSLKALEYIKKYALHIDWNWLFDCVKKNVDYECYRHDCVATGDIIYATEGEYNSLKEVML